MRIYLFVYRAFHNVLLSHFFCSPFWLHVTIFRSFRRFIAGGADLITLMSSVLFLCCTRRLTGSAHSDFSLMLIDTPALFLPSSAKTVCCEETQYGQSRSSNIMWLMLGWRLTKNGVLLLLTVLLVAPVAECTYKKIPHFFIWGS